MPAEFPQTQSARGRKEIGDYRNVNFGVLFGIAAFALSRVRCCLPQQVRTALPPSITATSPRP
jgi:hypothetical protein